MMEWEVLKEESRIKLIVFLKNHLNEQLSARQLKEAIERGCCQVNNRVERFASTLLGEGDKVAFYLKQVESVAHIDRVRALYIDDDLLIYDKPAGIVSDDPKFLNEIKKLFEGAVLVHRLDKDTTGALLFARQPDIYQSLTKLFKTREVTKTYLAMVDGHVKKSSGFVENFLGKLRLYQGQAIWGKVSEEKGVFAKTAWKLQKKGNHASLLLCYPETGRTHQIRVHMSGMGHPILGDYQYGRQFACTYMPSRCLLHAWEISFEHPRTKQNSHC